MDNRDITEVINKIKKCIPKGRTELLGALDDLVDSANYRAPELDYLNWEQLSSVLNYHIGEPIKKWESKISKIITGD